MRAGFPNFSAGSGDRMSRFVVATTYSAFIAAGALALAPEQALATTYYIDYGSGNDSNAGTTKTAAWQHAPGMKGCAGACATQTAHAGDQYVMKGGVTWPNGTMEWHWKLSGTSGNNILVGGLDTTWYDSTNCTNAGYSGYCRPVMNSQGAATPGTGLNRQLFLDASFVRVANIEWTGVNLTANTAVGYCDGISWCFNSNSHDWVFDQNYCHGWTHTSSATGNESSCGNGDTGSPSHNLNSVFHDNVCDGSDTTKDAGECLHGGPDVAYNNYCSYVVSCFVGEYANIHDNYIVNIIPSYGGAHENGIEINFVAQNCYVYNNYIANVGAGLAMWVAPEAGATCYVFNNVVVNQQYNTVLKGTPNTLDIAAALINPSGALSLYNNTFECGPDGDTTLSHWNVCTAGINNTITAVSMENNHWITMQTTGTNGVWSTNGPTPSQVTDLKQLPATAAAQGYKLAATYPFSPVAGGATIGTGTNLTSLCSGNLAALCSDTTLGVSYNNSNHTVVAPNRTPNARSSSGAWDIGAYLYAGSGPTLQPPTNLSATVQ